METTTMETTRADSHNLLLDIMNRLDIEEPETAKQVWALFGDMMHGFYITPSEVEVVRTHTARMLVPHLTPDEAARLHALMGLAS